MENATKNTSYAYTKPGCDNPDYINIACAESGQWQVIVRVDNHVNLIDKLSFQELLSLQSTINDAVIAANQFYGAMSPGSKILRYFAYEHLPSPLRVISKPIGDLARKMDAELCDCEEKSEGLRKLLESKDCFVRAAL